MIDAPGIDAWRAWTPHEVARRLASIDVPWCVAGGWALDLWHGRETRPHEDLEIAFPRSHFATVRAALADHEVFSVGDGEVAFLPRDATPPLAQHQTWVLDPRAREWRVDLFLEPGDATTWIYRRDESLQIPRADAVTGRIPYLIPELVLLFKAKRVRPKDELDFTTALPSLDRSRMRELLSRFHPDHAWLARL